MAIELNLRFPDTEHVVVRLDDQETEALPFAMPLTAKDHEDIRWYVETYGAHSLDDPDDAEATRIHEQLPLWGKRLFEAAFGDRAAERLFNRFQDAEGETRLLTISAEHPEILALPWELLAPDGVHLFREKISIRRRCAGADRGRARFKIETKERLHLLFVVSRPEGAGFIDPRADAAAVLDAIDRHAPGRVTVEFLRPAALNTLVERLDNPHLPAVDILHFDGHGVFDRTGGILKDRKAATGGVDSLSKDSAPDGAPHTGYLLFEDDAGQSALVSARQLGKELHRRKVALVILSACQSAAQGGDDPFGSVAVRLTQSGIPAVLAMTHSVLVATTRALFGEFYKHLAQGRSVGGALDRARAYLDRNPQKYEVQRGAERVPLKLHDWFLPALYQSGEDKALLQVDRSLDPDRSHASPPATQSVAGDVPTQSVGTMGGKLPPQPETGFFGRRRELWQIERWFAGQTRRVSLTGFGGQGKTALALEAGRWLVRTGLFQTAAFVNYAETPSRDAVAVAVAALSTVLDESLPDAAAATQALKRTTCLVILDNLEILDAETLAQLLDAAKDWSEAGGSRVLLTSRRPDFNHPAYTFSLRKTRIPNPHLRIVLNGLGSRDESDDALEWFAELQKLKSPPELPPPSREELIGLFEQVGFHPLSIRILAEQTKTRTALELGERLERLLVETEQTESEDVPLGLKASLQLSLDRLDGVARTWLPRLGVFQSGAFEDDLLAITEIPADQWPNLRRALETAALVEPENLPNVKPPFFRFHPALAPLLWLELDDVARERLGAAHHAQYYSLAEYLYHEDTRHPHDTRAIAWRELPNLLHAVRAALQRGEPKAVSFAGRVNRFLDYFGLRGEQAELARLGAQQATSIGSQTWVLMQSNRGKQLLASGQSEEAARVFQTILAALDEMANLTRAQTLCQLGRCFLAGGRPDLTVQAEQEALAILDKLELSDSVKQQIGNSWTGLADALRDLGQYQRARQAYLAGLAIAEEQKNARSQGVTIGQLGSLAFQEARHEEAFQYFQKALGVFQTLQEPDHEAIYWHQLGLVHQVERRWEEAERCYRESARIEEALGNQGGAAASWNQLAIMNKDMDKPAAAELWFRKAIAQHRANQNTLLLTGALTNLVELLRTQPGRLVEARSLAEQSLKLKQTLEPSAAEIWHIYYLLAQIAEQEAATATQPLELLQAARGYRHQSRKTYRAFPGNRIWLKTSAPLIVAACAVCTPPRHKSWFAHPFRSVQPDDSIAQARAALTEWQTLLREVGQVWAHLADALDRLRAGEREVETLLDRLDWGTGLILETILQGLADPASLDWLRAEAGEAE